jgi:hypothetical protein
LAGSTGKLVIGCGKDMTPGTFFTGLVDDVRIYSRAVKPQAISRTSCRKKGRQLQRVVVPSCRE